MSAKSKQLTETFSYHPQQPTVHVCLQVVCCLFEIKAYLRLRHKLITVVQGETIQHNLCQVNKKIYASSLLYKNICERPAV